MTSNQLSILARTRLAYNILRHGAPMRPPAAGQKAAPYAWPTFVNGQPVWQMIDFQKYVDQGYNINSLIRAAIDYKWKALTSAPLRAYEGDPEHPKRLPPTNALAKLLQRPNQHQSNIEFLGQQIVYENIAGNSYTYMDRGKQRRQAGDAAPLPEALWNLRPDRVYIVPGDNGIKGFMYKPDGKSLREAMPILPEDMMHVKLPNPGDPFEGMGYGLSPFSSFARDGDTDNSVTNFLKILFDNKTMLGGVLKFNMPLLDEEVADARRRWQEVYGGVDNWGDIAVLDNAGDFTPFSPDFQKLNFSSLDSRNEKRILGPLGVPGMLIGVSMDNSTFSNFEQADRVFWQNTFNPELALFEVEYQHFLTMNGAYPVYDKSAVPALQKNVPAMVDAAYKMWTMGTPRDDAYAVVGLNVPTTNDGKVGYIPTNMLPAGKSPSPAKELPAPIPTDKAQLVPKPALLPPGKKSAWTAEQKTVMGKAVDDIAVEHEDDFRDQAKTQFEADKRAILALATAMQEKSLVRKSTINWLEMLTDVKAYLDGLGAEAWKTAFVPLLEAVVEDAGDYWAAQTGLAFNVRNLLGEQWFADYTLVFAQPINQTTSDTIQTVLGQAQAEGWSINTMQTNLETLFQQWMDGDLSAEDFKWFSDRLPPHRAELIARTETTRIQNTGSFNLFKSWDVKKKEWLATGDNRTRPTHASANGQVKPMDDPFDVGNSKMMHPGDMSLGAPVSEIADCRCTVLPVMDD